jgi:predicted RNA binding protein YcfA (HicA-like mRNA interferase family)
VFELDGFVFKRGKGSHRVGEKKGVERPLVVIPEYSEIGLDIIRSNLRTAGITLERYLELQKKCYRVVALLPARRSIKSGSGTLTESFSAGRCDGAPSCTLA